VREVIAHLTTPALYDRERFMVSHVAKSFASNFATNVRALWLTSGMA
jgi:hypothetical protein